MVIRSCCRGDSSGDLPVPSIWNDHLAIRFRRSRGAVYPKPNTGESGQSGLWVVDWFFGKCSRESRFASGDDHLVFHREITTEKDSLGCLFSFLAY